MRGERQVGAAAAEGESGAGAPRRTATLGVRRSRPRSGSDRADRRCGQTGRGDARGDRGTERCDRSTVRPIDARRVRRAIPTASTRRRWHGRALRRRRGRAATPAARTAGASAASAVGAASSRRRCEVRAAAASVRFGCEAGRLGFDHRGRATTAAASARTCTRIRTEPAASASVQRTSLSSAACSSTATPGQRRDRAGPPPRRRATGGFRRLHRQPRQYAFAHSAPAMKLATYRDGSRDGQLVVVSRDLRHAHYASATATRLQQVLDDWNFHAPQLEDLSQALNHGRTRHAFAFEPARCMAPLPRAYQWADGSAFINHVELVRRGARRRDAGELLHRPADVPGRQRRPDRRVRRHRLRRRGVRHRLRGRGRGRSPATSRWASRPTRRSRASAS